MHEPNSQLVADVDQGVSPVLILHVKAGSGHTMAADALAEAGQELGYSTEVVDALALAPPWFAHAYVEAHRIGSRFTPALYGEVFAASNQPGTLREPVRRALDRAVGDGLVARVRELAPRAIVCTHFYPLTELGRLRQSGILDAPVVAVVTDYVAHALWVVSGVDLYCVPPGRAAEDLRRLGVGASNIVVTGIPVRSAFTRIRPWASPGEHEHLRLLITSGGLGPGPLGKIVRGCRGLARLELDVVCGRRPGLARRMRRTIERFPLNAIVTDFAQDMPERVERAHVVIGKSGGLTMSECLTAGRPMMVIGACPGQEVENLRTLREWGAGCDAKARDAGALALRWLEEGRLARMAEAARSHAIPDAARRVFRALKIECLSPGSRIDVRRGPPKHL